MKGAKMANIIIVIVLIVLVGAAGFYIVKEKKKGSKCIGCPNSGCCNLQNCKSDKQLIALFFIVIINQVPGIY